jgi:hypothetical protein
MRNSVILLSLFILGLLFSGCAGKNSPTKDLVYEDKNGITNIELVMNVKQYNEDYSNKELKPGREKTYRRDIDLLKRSLLAAANKTLEKNKSNFVILNPEINHLAGFHLTNYSDIKKFCFTKERQPNEIKLECKSILPKSIYSITGSLKILPIDKTDYRIFSIDAKKIIEEINKEPIQ